jgi:hypothetical protein
MTVLRYAKNGLEREFTNLRKQAAKKEEKAQSQHKLPRMRSMDQVTQHVEEHLSVSGSGCWKPFLNNPSQFPSLANYQRLRTVDG